MMSWWYHRHINLRVLLPALSLKKDSVSNRPPKKTFSVSKKIYVYFIKEVCNQERIDYLPAYCGFCETNFSNRCFANQMAGFHKFVINNNHSEIKFIIHLSIRECVCPTFFLLVSNQMQFWNISLMRKQLDLFFSLPSHRLEDAMQTPCLRAIILSNQIWPLPNNSCE